MGLLFAQENCPIFVTRFAGAKASKKSLPLEKKEVPAGIRQEEFSAIQFISGHSFNSSFSYIHITTRTYSKHFSTTEHCCCSSTESLGLSVCLSMVAQSRR
jgi:hypothetical protein